MGGGQVSFTRQKGTAGLAHARVVLPRDVLLAMSPSPFWLGDVLIPAPIPRQSQLIEVYEPRRRAIAVEEVPKDKTNLTASGWRTRAANRFVESLLRIPRLVEKPKPENAPSNLAITAATSCRPGFDVWSAPKPGAQRNPIDGRLRILSREQGCGPTL